MKAACILITLTAMLAIAESETFRPRSPLDDEEFEQSIQTACLDPLDLTPEELAAMEKTWEIQNLGARAPRVNSLKFAYYLYLLLKENEDDFEKVLERLTPNQAVVHSLKPKILMFLTCVSDEAMKADHHPR
uniref:Putative secreted protein n=1 Tax=Ixodes ricinus TaxID=34613 RepID=A0A0K8RCN2_IXORI